MEETNNNELPILEHPEMIEYSNKIDEVLRQIQVLKKDLEILRKDKKTAYNRIYMRQNDAPAYRRGPYKTKVKADAKFEKEKAKVLEQFKDLFD